MSLLRAVFDPRASALTDLTDPAAWTVLGGGFGRKTTAGEAVSPATALSLSTYFACVRAIAEDVGKLPFVLYHRLAGGGKERALDKPLYRLLLKRPNPEMSAGVFRETMTGWALGWGNGYAEIERDRRGVPVALWPIHPSRVQVLRVDGAVTYRVHSPEWQPGAVVEFTPRDVLHLRGFGDNPLVGLSTASLAAESIGVSLAAQTFGAAFFGNGATLGLTLMHPGKLGEKGIVALREGWTKVHSGPGNAHRVAVLEEGMKVERTSIPPNEAQFIETRGFQVDEICRWFRMPPHKVQQLGRSTFSNIEQQSLEYVTDTLMPWLRRWEEETEVKLIDDRDQEQYDIEHDVAALLRGDAAARSNYFRTMISTGAMSPDEARERENLNPIPGGAGKQFFMQGAMATLDRIVNPPEPVAPAPRGAPPADDPADDPATDPKDPEDDNAAAQAQALRPLFDEAEARVRRKEEHALATAARKGGGKPAAAWAGEFYVELAANAVDSFFPICSVFRGLSGRQLADGEINEAIRAHFERARAHALATGAQFTPDQPLAATISALLLLES